MASIVNSSRHFSTSEGIDCIFLRIYLITFNTPCIPKLFHIYTYYYILRTQEVLLIWSILQVVCRQVFLLMISVMTIKLHVLEDGTL